MTKGGSQRSTGSYLHVLFRQLRNFGTVELDFGQCIVILNNTGYLGCYVLIIMDDP